MKTNLKKKRIFPVPGNLLGLLVLALLFFTSCLDMTVELRFTGVTNGTLLLEYRIPAILEGLRMIPGERGHLPRTRQEWDTLLVGTGMQVNEFQRQDSGEFRQVQLLMTFPTVAALRQLFQNLGQDLVLVQREATIQFSQTYRLPREVRPSPETLTIMETLSPDSRIRFVLLPPRPILNNNQGELSADRRRLEWTLESRSFLVQDPGVWTASW